MTEEEIDRYNENESRRYYQEQAKGKYILYVYFPAIGTGEWRLVDRSIRYMLILEVYNQLKAEGRKLRLYNANGDLVLSN